MLFRYRRRVVFLHRLKVYCKAFVTTVSYVGCTRTAALNSNICALRTAALINHKGGDLIGDIQIEFAHAHVGLLHVTVKKVDALPLRNNEALIVVGHALAGAQLLSVALFPKPFPKLPARPRVQQKLGLVVVIVEPTSPLRLSEERHPP